MNDSETIMIHGVTGQIHNLTVGDIKYITNLLNGCIDREAPSTPIYSVWIQNIIFRLEKVVK